MGTLLVHTDGVEFSFEVKILGVAGPPRDAWPEGDTFSFGLCGRVIISCHVEGMRVRHWRWQGRFRGRSARRRPWPKRRRGKRLVVGGRAKASAMTHRVAELFVGVGDRDVLGARGGDGGRRGLVRRHMRA